MKTLEELLALLEEAKAKALADPTNEDLKAAEADAQTAYDEKLASGTGDPSEPSEDFDESKADEKTKKYLAKLRKENASHRTRAKDLASKAKGLEERNKAILKAAGIETEEDKPEEKVKVLSQEKSTLAFRNAVLETALEHGVPADGIKYFQYLLADATDALEEGEELSEESLAEIVAEVKKGRSKGSANSSVTTGKDGKKAPSPGGNSNTITLEKFCSMSMVEKSKLFETNQSLYTELMMQAKAKKKLV